MVRRAIEDVVTQLSGAAARPVPEGRLVRPSFIMSHAPSAPSIQMG